MKKILVLMMALVMTLSLAACGGVDKDAVTKAFNNTNTAYNTVATYANENLDKMDQPTMDELTVIGDALAAFKAEIESNDLTQERADEIIAELEAFPANIAEAKTKVDALIAGSDAGVTEEQAATLAQLAQSLTAVHAKYAEHYDSFDDETKAFVDEIAQTVTDIGRVLEGSIEINGTQADLVIEGSLEVLEAAESGWTEIEAQLAE